MKSQQPSKALTDYFQRLSPRQQRLELESSLRTLQNLEGSKSVDPAWIRSRRAELLAAIEKLPPARKRTASKRRTSR